MLKIKDISIYFPSFSLRNINLEVEAGDYFVLLGSSGSGKTVLLETIAGMISPHSGEIFLRDKNITHEKIQHRKIGIVFQDYALFPHLSVFENIAFPLKQENIHKKELETIVHQLAKELEISHLLQRKPHGLSGGEMQRVALARTLAMKPDVLLLDEPLSALDAKLRRETRMLLRNLNRKGQTIVHVTHDYEEAVVLANKVAVISNGTIEQTGSPLEVFQNPKSAFVASLAGIKNYFQAEIISCNEEKQTVIARIEDKMEVEITALQKTGKGMLIIDSNEITLSPEKQADAINQFQGTIKDIINHLHGMEILVDIGVPVVVNLSAEALQKPPAKIGENVWIGLKMEAIKYIESR